MRVGVIGVGHLGYHHARILRSLASEVTVFDAREARTAEVASELGVAAASSASELLSRVDAVVVASDTVTHHDVVMQALAAGCHTLVEKPIASDSIQAARLASEAERLGLVLAVGHVERFNPAVVAAGALIDSPMFVEAHRLAPFKHRGIDVSVVMDLMIHDIDLVLSFVRSPVSEVHASGVAVLTDKVDIASARVMFANGAVANLTASRISREPMRKLRFFQQRGYVSIDFAGRTVEALKVDGESIRPVPVVVTDADPLTCELQDFLSACGGGGRPLVGAAEGVRAIRAAELITSRMTTAGSA
ncbi:MAG TPA: Gfo/Idh/MocA family oxidoreductase [Candidatus Fermentibacter daniensis]|nr:Gfo/Idh/MocA family oxidoreductase [Candidatus Fermentibacter daniensis]HOR06716.1 Gfo/Idh/MocA family oxidoreductase [Candidatus Fermentibacter daniensis]HPK50945.1 Gfo/Idh/MocA family oxidoreductase [Candidatus Fermentibacter daniensis]HQE55862.1 Gfo/Idh/MocA family oxidoreductase [Candidatus Fermentibacter daniensis]